jgi:sugar/nucleoside kinase (ribokinase family)
VTGPFGRLLHLGNVVVDVVLTVPALPERGGDVLATSTEISAGGGFNVMAAARRQGLPVAYAGVLGGGPFGQIASAACAIEGIEVLQPARPDVDSGFVIGIVDAAGERTFLTSRGAEATLTAADLDLVHPGPRDAVYLSGYGLVHPANRAALLGWLRGLADGRLVIVDPGPLVLSVPGDVLDAVLGRADWLTCNAREATLLTGSPDPLGALRLLTARTGRVGVLVRTGPDGCLLGHRTGPAQHVPGFAVSVVDTNGAGDTHTGVFLAALAAGEPEAAAARLANAAAALSVTKRGPATSPTRAELAHFLADRGNALLPAARLACCTVLPSMTLSVVARTAPCAGKLWFFRAHAGVSDGQSWNRSPVIDHYGGRSMPLQSTARKPVRRGSANTARARTRTSGTTRRVASKPKARSSARPTAAKTASAAAVAARTVSSAATKVTSAATKMTSAATKATSSAKTLSTALQAINTATKAMSIAAKELTAAAKTLPAAKAQAAPKRTTAAKKAPARKSTAAKAAPARKTTVKRASAKTAPVRKTTRPAITAKPRTPAKPKATRPSLNATAHKPAKPKAAKPSLNTTTPKAVKPKTVKPKTVKPKTVTARTSGSTIKPRGTTKPGSTSKRTTVTAKPANRPANSRPAAGAARKPGSVRRPLALSSTRSPGPGEYRDVLAGLLR